MKQNTQQKTKWDQQQHETHQNTGRIPQHSYL